jgi:hypothetical protein
LQTLQLDPQSHRVRNPLKNRPLAKRQRDYHQQHVPHTKPRTQTQLFSLTHKYTFHFFGNDIALHVGLRIFALGAQDGFQLIIRIKVIFNRALISASYKN